MPVRTRVARSFAALAALTMIAAACGDDDETADTGGQAPAASTTSTAAEANEASLVEIVDSEFGAILASDGRTLYTFMPDDAGAPTCYDDCAATWPALLATGDVTVGDGLDAASFSTVARDDGGQQVTVDGWPLYFFANDTAPGDTNGQGVGDRWYVVAPDGTAIQNAPSTGGYGG